MDIIVIVLQNYPQYVRIDDLVSLYVVHNNFKGILDNIYILNILLAYHGVKLHKQR